MGWFFLATILLLSLCGCCETVNHIFRKSDAAGAPMPQSGSTGSHGQPQAGSSPSTPGPGGGGSIGGATGSGGGGGGGGATGFSTGAAGAATFGLGVTGGSTGGGAGGGAAGGGAAASETGSRWADKGPRRGRGWRDWRRGDPTLIKGLWKSKGPLDSLGQAEIYIIVALLIGFFTVVIGCWLSDNCWSPEPEGVVTLA
ncbi:PREDICTED: putative glycine-rich cell wall structural protein 1 isoform X4 [Acromyrmex echinatior]|uniref:putative glycine-rich cell wall structural protein 1 isoform X4 n=1 Tax=Acromyrmex echinatior TaxID=103372 RepID=UPI000580F79E|nr:PREDICTED: putative glycine-rich cell wall structural protein 1 isoform X4 [Acromyrmex echinatior]XP_011061327.1 PREDICTED: putative glycine-rich cell wall structural protein 1 isoform X4 [Acromyrmex echinatior]XP_011061328.1 PREDICTED: putative glycine-rich cell wall structural protein 1 isoform X4 [Acromyrmex echinatior]